MKAEHDIRNYKKNEKNVNTLNFYKRKKGKKRTIKKRNHLSK